MNFPSVLCFFFFFFLNDFGRPCYDIAHTKQTCTPRTMKWLKMSAEEGCEDGVITYAGLLHGSNPDLQHREMKQLGLLSKYLVKRRQRKILSRTSTLVPILSSLMEIAYHVFSPSSFTASLSVFHTFHNQCLCFLPLLFSLFLNFKQLTLSNPFGRFKNII